jgi:preprotein translocase SecE subunit
MATAVEPNPAPAPAAPSKPLSLPAASLIGAVYTIAALMVVFALLPSLWAERVTPMVKDNLINWLLWLPALCGTAAGLIWFGNKLADGGPKGVHGGAFLVTCAAITAFFFFRAGAMWADGVAGYVLGGVMGLMVAYFAFRFFTGRTGERWSVGLEEQGWFSLAQYKRSLGVKVRRLTILGILLVGGSGAWSLYNQGVVPERWTLAMPAGIQPLLVMQGAKTGVLVVIVLASLWVAFRAVNIPSFAEFLIATEAEMNKVSWSTRKRLAQDTVVVLVTTLIMTLFLLVVDLFWGWLLSRQTVGVLPGRATNADKKGQSQEAKW